MKRMMILALLAVFLLSILGPTALALEVCYPTSIEQSDDGSEIRKTYDLGLEDDPGGIPRSDFEQNGWNYSLTDLLKQETPEYQEREHTETVTVTSKKKDMESVLALLPAQKEFTTEDGLTGTLALKLDTVQVDAAGYGSSTRQVSTTRSYPNLAGQDTTHIPKEITDNGRTLELASIDWRAENAANEDGSAAADRYTAVVTYTGTATSSYVKGYVVTAQYSGTVSRIALNKIRYVAIFEGTPLALPEPEPTPEPTQEPSQEPAAPVQFHWGYVLVPLGAVAAIGGGVGAALFLKKRRENSYETEEDG